MVSQLPHLPGLVAGRPQAPVAWEGMRRIQVYEIHTRKALATRVISASTEPGVQ